MTELIDTTEMYLRTIFELEEEGVPALRARIAERLGHSGPTVSQTVARMERDGLLRVESDRSIELSADGRTRAIRVMRKHRLAERLLIDVIGMEYDEVHAEACRWEHVMSDRVERRILGLLSSHDTSPYGNPIPGLDELGVTGADVHRPPLFALAAIPDKDPVTVVVERFGESLQADRRAMASLHEAGVVPGARAIVQRDGELYSIDRVGGSDSALTVPPGDAMHIFLRRTDR